MNRIVSVAFGSLLSLVSGLIVRNAGEQPQPLNEQALAKLGIATLDLSAAKTAAGGCGDTLGCTQGSGK